MTADTNYQKLRIKVEHLRSLTINPDHKDPKPTSSQQLIKDLKQLFEMGGVVSGGAAVALIHKRPIKDVDIYFNNEKSFVDACDLTYHNPYVDVCWYFDQPHSLHDLGITMCNIHPDERIEITPLAQKALDTGISDICFENLFWPELTALRMLKYNRKYQVRFHKSQALALAGIGKLDKLLSQLLEISV